MKTRIKPYVLNQNECDELCYIVSFFESDYSLNINDNAFEQVKSMEELVDVIYRSFLKEETIEKEDCTSQQAFYKVREVLQKYTNQSVIEPNSRLETIISRTDRIANVKGIEEELGFKLNILEPQKSTITVWWFVLCGLLVLTFFDVLYALMGLIVWFFVYKIIYDFGKEFKINTMRELVNQIVMNNYFESRRNPNIINEKEVKILIIDYISLHLGITKEELLLVQFG